MASLMQLPVYTFTHIHHGVYKWVLYNPFIESSMKFPKEPYPTQADDLNHIELLHTSGCHYDCIGTEDEGLPLLYLTFQKMSNILIVHKTTQYTDKTQSHYCMPWTLTLYFKYFTLLCHIKSSCNHAHLIHIQVHYSQYSRWVGRTT